MEILIFVFVSAMLVYGDGESASLGHRSGEGGATHGPLGPNDALYTIPWLTGRVRLVGDLNGDGESDLVGQFGNSCSPIEALTLRGEKIRTLWSPSFEDASLGMRSCSSFSRLTPMPWDAGGDCDGDSVPDLVVGMPWKGVGGAWFGAVFLVSGKDGSIIRTEVAESAIALGSSVCFVGDVDGDGMDDYAVGAAQLSAWGLRMPARVASRFTHDGGADHEGRWGLVLSDGKEVAVGDVWQKQIFARSPDAGYVALVSGATGREVWRRSGRAPGGAYGMHVAAAGDVNSDGLGDVLVHADPRARLTIDVLSGKNGALVTTLPNKLGWAEGGGDVDGDGVGDILLDRMDDENIGFFGGVTIVSGRRWEAVRELRYADVWDEYAVTRAVGDFDADGFADIAVGGPNYNLPHDLTLEGLQALSLSEAVDVGSRPTNSFTAESGRAFVYSGRSGKVLSGVWGDPAARLGMGREVLCLPDVNGDGHLDLLVSDSQRAYVFAGG